MSATAPMEAPIAADAPLDKPFELEDEEVLVAEALVAEAGAVPVGEPEVVLEVGILVARGVFIVENALSLIAPSCVKEYLWPS